MTDTHLAPTTPLDRAAAEIAEELAAYRGDTDNIDAEEWADGTPLGVRRSGHMDSREAELYRRGVRGEAVPVPADRTVELTRIDTATLRPVPAGVFHIVDADTGQPVDAGEVLAVADDEAATTRWAFVWGDDEAGWWYPLHTAVSVPSDRPGWVGVGWVWRTFALAATRPYTHRDILDRAEAIADRDRPRGAAAPTEEQAGELDRWRSSLPGEFGIAISEAHRTETGTAVQSTTNPDDRHQAVAYVISEDSGLTWALTRCGQWLPLAVRLDEAGTFYALVDDPEAL